MLSCFYAEANVKFSMVFRFSNNVIFSPICILRAFIKTPQTNFISFILLLMPHHFHSQLAKAHQAIHLLLIILKYNKYLLLYHLYFFVVRLCSRHYLQSMQSKYYRLLFITRQCRQCINYWGLENSLKVKKKKLSIIYE